MGIMDDTVRKADATWAEGHGGVETKPVAFW